MNSLLYRFRFVLLVPAHELNLKVVSIVFFRVQVIVIQPRLNLWLEPA